jgi:isochorismate pyruvate lyase
MIFRFVFAFLVINTLFNKVSANEMTMNSYYEIVKQDYHDLSEIRVEINRINNEILQLLAERTAYVKRVGDLKSKTHRIAEDRQRIVAQEQIIIHKSNELELPEEISVPTFRAIVEASTKYQQDYIDQLPIK